LRIAAALRIDQSFQCHLDTRMCRVLPLATGVRSAAYRWCSVPQSLVGSC
jgi:hypothetical protein